jgi:L-fuculose-phosphate aldolase
VVEAHARSVTDWVRMPASRMTEFEHRRHLVEICRRMYRQGFIAAADGNVSVRLGKDRLLITPSGMHKGYIDEQDLVVTDLHGKRLGGKRRPSSEFMLHEVMYAERPDVAAVVHAHPPITVTLALAGVDLTACVLSETCLALGPVPTVPYSTPTTQEVPVALRRFARNASAMVMDRHGSITVGRSLDEAYNRLEALEHASRIIHAAHLIKPVTALPPEQEAKLRALAAEIMSRC